MIVVVVAMEVGSSSSSSYRMPKPEDIASSSRGITSTEGLFPSEDHFHRSDSVPKLEDLIAGDSRLEELYKGDAANAAKQTSASQAEDSSEEDEDMQGGDGDAPGPCGGRGHSLRFLAVAPYPSGSFVCNRCTERLTGEVYNCEICLFDLCPNCCVPERTPPSSALVVSSIPSSWGQPLLGCRNSSHVLAVLESAPYESGAYLCNLCLKTGEAEVYHCTSCQGKWCE